MTSPSGEPKRWTATLRRIVAAIDSWPGWVMVLVALACLILAVWLLTGMHELGLSQPPDPAGPGRLP